MWNDPNKGPHWSRLTLSACFVQTIRRRNRRGRREIMTTWSELLTDEQMMDRRGRELESVLWTARSKRAVITTAHYHATRAGAQVLEDGGNVVDAAVAASLALGVVEPAASGVGGMGMMVVHDASKGRTFCLEGPCLAPMAARPDAVASGLRKRSHRAVALPSLIALVNHALQRYGTISAARALEPAIELAEEGYPISPFQHVLIAKHERLLAKGTAASIFLDQDARALQPGTVLRQPVVARTLRRLAEAGLDDFYTGEIGRAIVRDMEASGGFLSSSDFEQPPVIREVEPLRGCMGDLEVCTPPPPGGGSTLLQLLGMFDALDLPSLDPDSAEAALVFASLIKRARLDRKENSQGLVRVSGREVELFHPLHVRSAARELEADLQNDEGGETTHLCVMDSDGNAVSMTQSIERSFGAKVVTPELGFLYNGYLSTFKVQNREHPFFLRPGLPARSNATPSILFAHNRPRAAIGSTGSERMASGIFQVLARLEHGQSPFRAVAAPRLHCTPMGDVFLEAARFDPEALRLLERRGFTLTTYSPWAFEVGGLQLVTFDGDAIEGVAEPRRDGAAAGMQPITTQ